MRRPLLFIAAMAVCLPFMWAQDTDINTIRTYDGTYNNLDNPTWGSAGENLKILFGLNYADGIAAPTGNNRANPREISNTLFSQTGLINDPANLSDFCWVYGQFLDHDIGLTPDGANEPMIIRVPAGDIWFDPQGTGQVVIPMMRNLFDPSTGTNANNPRRHPNMITAYVDGSGVYGSDEERANWLRTFEGGKLKVSSGNMLPFNTTTGEFDAPVDHSVPEMDNPVRMTDKLFVAGDVRANENPLLLGFHTIFVREHNRVAEKLAGEHPDWNDEQLYQHARKIVGGYIQNITFNEFLPAMGVRLAPYTGYNNDIHPQLSNVFTAAAFRLGHTLLNGNLQRVMSDGTPHPDGPVALRSAFFNHLMVMEEDNGIEVFLKGMAVQTQQQLDARVIDDVRNFLFGPPGAGGLDLAAININRGRERGLPDFNSLRRTLGLKPYDLFQQINPDDRRVGQLMLSLYRNVNDIDPWVGLLSERPMPGSIMGETLMTILQQQFQALRDGDRFYFENDPVLSEEEKEDIRNTAMHDIIMRNTPIKLMQGKVFEAMAHEEICDNNKVEVFGSVKMEGGRPVPHVEIELSLGGESMQIITGNDGVFSFLSVPGCDIKEMIVEKDVHDDPNGVSTLDLVLVQKHILNRQLLDSPFKIIAADVDGSGTVSTLDLIKMRRIILSLDSRFGDDAPWKFIPADFEFTDPFNPFLDDFPTSLNFDVLTRDYQKEYIAIKLGDVNNSANLGDNAQGELDLRTQAQPLVFSANDQALLPGNSIRVPVLASGVAELQGFQFGLRYDPSLVELVAVTGEQIDLGSQHMAHLPERGSLKFSWNVAEGSPVVDAGQVLFVMEFRAKAEGLLSAALQLDDRSIAAEAYNGALDVLPVRWKFGELFVAEKGFQLLQNEPNPFSDITQIPFYLPEAGSVRIKVSDINGKEVYQREAAFPAGMNRIELNTRILNARGVLIYQLQSGETVLSKKMTIIE